MSQYWEFFVQYRAFVWSLTTKEILHCRDFVSEKIKDIVSVMSMYSLSYASGRFIQASHFH